MIIDISAHQTSLNGDIALAAGVDAVLIKSSMGFGVDPLCRAHVAECKRVGLPFGLYHWVDPTASAASQGAIFKRMVDELQPAWIELDIEQCWSSWPAYWQYVYYKTITWDQVPKYSQADISKHAKSLIYWVTQNIDRPMLIYSGLWFFNSYARPMYEYINSYPLHLAEYTDKVLRTLQPGEVPAYVEQYIGREPRHQKGSEWEIWQFSSYNTIPGLVPGRVDMNITRRAFPDFMAWLQSDTPEPPPPAPVSWQVITIATKGLRIRKEPSITSERVGCLFYGSVVAVTENQNGWLRLADGRGWISALYARSV